MRSSNNMSGHEFACPFRGSDPGIHCRLNRTDFTAHHDGHIAATNFFLANQLHVRDFAHRIGGFNGRDQAACFDHA